VPTKYALCTCLIGTASAYSVQKTNICVHSGNRIRHKTSVLTWRAWLG